MALLLATLLLLGASRYHAEQRVDQLQQRLALDGKAKGLLEDLDARMALTRAYAVTGEERFTEDLWAWAVGDRSTDRVFQLLLAHDLTASERTVVETARMNAEVMLDYEAHVIELAGAGDRAAAVAAAHGDPYTRIVRSVTEPLREFTALVDARTASSVLRTSRRGDDYAIAALALLVASTLITLLTHSVFAMRGVIRPLRELVEDVRALDRMGEHDRVRHTGKRNEIGLLARALDDRRQAQILLRAAQSRIERQEAELRTMLANVPCGIMVTWPDRTVRLCNEMAASLLELPPELMAPGTALADISRFRAERGDFGPGDLSVVLAERRNALNEAVDGSLADRSPSGRALQISSRLLDDGGRVAIVVDVSERERMERELIEAREKAEQAARTKAAFLATMSHELRTPMNGVVGMVDLLTETELDEEQREMTHSVRDSAFALLGIIDDILDISKIEAGRLTLENAPMSLRDLVEGVNATLLPSAAGKRLVLHEFVDPALPDLVAGDPLRVRQVLMNLVGNAVKFTATSPDRTGRVIVRADRVPSASEQEGRITVRYSVIDNGIGIAPEVQANLFEPFVQADDSTTRRFGGTGLGLAISRELVSLMDGSIELESSEGVGSTFTVTSSYPVLGTERNAGEKADLSEVRILLVADDPDIREFWPRYLRHHGATVSLARSLVEAASGARAEDAALDLVIVASGDRPEEQDAFCERLRARAGGRRGVRFLLCRPGGSFAARPHGDDAVVFDPGTLARSRFLKAVAVVLGRASPEIDYRAEPESHGPRLPVPDFEESLACGRLVLVAEDNHTNREVIRRQLARFGYASEIVEDGRAALEAWQARRHALVMTDCHMPIMDGFELAAAIRRAEAHGERATTIVAITANALEGEAERCFAAGMDEVLEKPVEMRRLRLLLEQRLPQDDVGRGTGSPSDAPATARAPDPVPVDFAALAEIFGDDRATIREVMEEFVAPSQEIVASVLAARHRRSAADVARGAHKLKSSARTVGAHALADACVTLERAGYAGDWARIDETASRLPKLLREVEAYSHRL